MGSAVVRRGEGCVGRADLVMEELALVLGQLDENVRLRLLPAFVVSRSIEVIHQFGDAALRLLFQPGDEPLKP